MTLTKECLEAFELWYLDNFSDFKDRDTDLNEIEIDNFWSKPLAEQWGVLQLFFDSVGVIISIHDVWVEKDLYCFMYEVMINGEEVPDRYYDDEGLEEPILKTRPEAWEAAIEAANKQFNENYGIY